MTGLGLLPFLFLENIWPFDYFCVHLHIQTLTLSPKKRRQTGMETYMERRLLDALFFNESKLRTFQVC